MLLLSLICTNEVALRVKGGCHVTEAEGAEAQEHCHDADARRAGWAAEKLRIFAKVRAAEGFVSVDARPKIFFSD